MMIPKLHYIAQGNTLKEQLEHIQKACAYGIELVQLGLSNSSDKKFLKFAEEARSITSQFQTRLILSDHYKMAKTIKADGVYLEKTTTCPTVIRKHLYSWQLLGGAANTLEDCETLIAKDVDYVGLGPFRSATNMGDTSLTLGLEGFAAITEALQTETPIIGIGGITTEDVKALIATGISGIMVSRAITYDFNTIKTFNQLLQASSTEEQRYTFK